MSKSQVIQNLDNTCEFSDVSIATKLSETGWLTILSGSALKLYLHFASLDEKKIPLSGNNSKLKKELFFSKTTAIGAPQELEAFGLIRCVSVFDNGSKLFLYCKHKLTEITVKYIIIKYYGILSICPGIMISISYSYNFLN